MMRGKFGKQLSLVGLLVVVGCGPQEMPKGTGASGTLKATDANEDMGLALINKLTEDQQQSMDWLSRSFDTAATVTEDLNDEEKSKLEKIQKHWETVEFANLDGINGQKIVHVAMVKTNVGGIQIYFTSDYTPDYVRSFLSMAETGQLNDLKLTLKDGIAWFGSPEQKPLYSLEASSYVPSFRAGVLLVPKKEDKAAGTVFGLTLVPKPEMADKASAFGGTTPTENDNILEKVYEALKKEDQSVVVEGVEVKAGGTRLFRDEGVSLIPVGPDGRPKTDASGAPVMQLPR